MTDPLFPPLGHLVEDLTPREHARTAFYFLIEFAELQIAALAAIGTVGILFGLSPAGDLAFSVSHSGDIAFGLSPTGDVALFIISIFGLAGCAVFPIIYLALVRVLRPLPERWAGGGEPAAGAFRRALIAGAAWWGRRRYRTLGVLWLILMFFFHNFFGLMKSVLETASNFWQEFLALTCILALIHGLSALTFLFTGMLVDRGEKPGTPDSH